MNTRELISKGIDILQLIFGSYLESILESEYGKNWESNCEENDEDMKEKYFNSKKNNKFTKDLNFYLNILIKYYSKLNFSNNNIKNQAFMIRNFRNKWAHNYSFSEREAYRVIDFFQSFLEELNLDSYDINIIRLEALQGLVNYEMKTKDLNKQKPSNLYDCKINVNINMNNSNENNFLFNSPNINQTKQHEGNKSVNIKSTPKSNNDLISMNRDYLQNSDINLKNNNSLKNKGENTKKNSTIYFYKDYKISEWDDEMDEDSYHPKEEDKYKMNNLQTNGNFNFYNNLSQSIIPNSTNNHQNKSINFKNMSGYNINNNLHFNYDSDNQNDRKYF